MSNVKFSVIIPAYNASNEIEKSIESVLKQGYNNYELIIVNDCSTDNTKEIVKKYPSIKLVNNERNKKAGGARNAGIENAKRRLHSFSRFR